MQEQSAKRQVVDQLHDSLALVPLSWQQQEANEIAYRVYQGHDLCAQTAARAANGLMLSPPFAPDAFW